MIACPKCQASAEDGGFECARCGVVFARWHDPAIAAPLAPRPSAALPDPTRNVVRVARAAGLVILIAWTWQFARLGVSEAVGASMLHMPDLVFHEAGHVIFGFFGRFLTVLGGSLLQCLVPIILAVAFLRQRN